MAATTAIKTWWLDRRTDSLVHDFPALLLPQYRQPVADLALLRPWGFFLERVVFPFELLTFACPADSEVKIWHLDGAGPTLVDCCLAEAMLCGDAPEERAVAELGSSQS